MSLAMSINFHLREEGRKNDEREFLLLSIRYTGLELARRAAGRKAGGRERAGKGGKHDWQTPS